MLKYPIVIIAIILFEMYNYSGVQCMTFSEFFKGEFHCYEGKKAEERFLIEEANKLQAIQKIEKEIHDAKAGLSVKNTVKTLIPTSKNIMSYLWNTIKKGFQIAFDFVNIWNRDHGKSKLKHERNKQKEDELFNNRFKGEKICALAFEHEFFKDIKKWDLVADDWKTKERKKLWIRVQTEYHEKEIDRQKFWRPSKRCMARKKQRDSKDDPNTPFNVYISAAEDFSFGSTFGAKHLRMLVFLETAREKLDNWNKWIFFWQRVVHVIGYTW